MKYLLITLLLCLGCVFMSPAPKVVQDTFYKVHEEMGYDDKAGNKEWTIPPAGEASWLTYGRHGTCSNFASLYRLRLNQAGISEDRSKINPVIIAIN